MPRCNIRWLGGVGALGLALGLAGCTRQGQFQPVSMWNNSRIKPLEPSPFGGDASSSLTLPKGVVARGQIWKGETLMSGRVNGELAEKFPIPITAAVVRRGQERFNVYCSPCHGRAGDGKGMIVERGFPAPPDYAIKRLREAPVGHFFDVITNGYGVMYSYAARVTPEDRWAVISYIRALQAQRKEVPVESGKDARKKARELGIKEPKRRED